MQKRVARISNRKSSDLPRVSASQRVNIDQVTYGQLRTMAQWAGLPIKNVLEHAVQAYWEIHQTRLQEKGVLEPEMQKPEFFGNPTDEQKTAAQAFFDQNYQTWIRNHSAEPSWWVIIECDISSQYRMRRTYEDARALGMDMFAGGGWLLIQFPIGMKTLAPQYIDNRATS